MLLTAVQTEMDTLWAQELGVDSSCADREFKEGSPRIFNKSQTAV